MGEQCSPVQLCGYAKFYGRTLCATIISTNQTEGAASSTPRFGPGGANLEKDTKALRKMQHSCIFLLLGPSTSALGFLGASSP